MKSCLTGTELQFCKMKRVLEIALHNNVKVLNTLNCTLKNGSDDKHVYFTTIKNLKI